ncbi:kinase-like protein [Pseudovirgaria hyperparasitica]|uniref:Kinase-like protein n=1 Tax=Pseudovirgaria hyperparasitica TaxID=470096 RepID=A0A6A6WM86_9PEZI|nr:kinase-like protein [Pseudovirgaria hyperparasitica]KAF2763315.1 kinase-like protein [Pseudovirgaria hyperparasitica]
MPTNLVQLGEVSLGLDEPTRRQSELTEIQGVHSSIPGNTKTPPQSLIPVASNASEPRSSSLGSSITLEPHLANIDRSTSSDPRSLTASSSEPTSECIPIEFDQTNLPSSQVEPIVHEAPSSSTISSVWEDWSGRGSHVDFRRDESLPLVAGRELGVGRNGHVYETKCKGVALAWKRRIRRGKWGPEQRKEIDILKRLSHDHIIKLIGTYTQGNTLGVLLWPVATCDLDTLFLDIELLHHPDRLAAWEGRRETIHERLEALGLEMPEATCTDQRQRGHHKKLLTLVGCIACAVEFLHSQNIRHKDIKPANVLITKNGLWLTDFDMSTDFSLLSSSDTENGERGTPKYFAPEVAAYEPSGRAADIFSLGCLFLELHCLSSGACLEDLKALRPAQNQSYHANLHNRNSWINLIGGNVEERIELLYFRILISRMLELDPSRRLSAKKVVRYISMLERYPSFGTPAMWHRPCCDPREQLVKKKKYQDKITGGESQLGATIGSWELLFESVEMAFGWALEKKLYRTKLDLHDTALSPKIDRKWELQEKLMKDKLAEKEKTVETFARQNESLKHELSESHARQQEQAREIEAMRRQLSELGVEPTAEDRNL